MKGVYVEGEGGLCVDVGVAPPGAGEDAPEAPLLLGSEGVAAGSVLCVGIPATWSVSRLSAHRLKLVKIFPAAEQSQTKMHGLRGFQGQNG